MRAIRQRVQGKLIEENGRFALLLHNHRPEKLAPNLLYLRYALTVMGTEAHRFPAYLLDDWGKEVRGLALYQWLYEFGEQFPRAEIFGFEPNGSRTQFFARELEQYAKPVVYVYESRTAALHDGKQLEAICIEAIDCAVPEKIKRPAIIKKRPLRSARLNWWQISPNTADFSFAFQGTPPKPGF